MKHPVVWFEVNGKDGKALQSFYSSLFDWKIKVDNPMGYGMVEAEQGKGIAGGVGQKGEGMNHDLTFYVSTTSIEESLGKAKKLGAKVLMPRTELPGGVILALFADPEGNPIGLVEEA